MTTQINIQEIIKLVQEQYPDRQDLVEAFQNCNNGRWTSKGYYRFVDSKNANETNAEWQHDDCIVLEQKDKGDIIIDLLKDGRIGGLEFLDHIEK